jgi:hypothetical protein
MFRGPTESGEVSVPQSKSTVGFNPSYLYPDEARGGISFVYWGTQFNSFQAPLIPGSSDSVAEKDSSYSVFVLRPSPARASVENPIELLWRVGARFRLGIVLYLRGKIPVRRLERRQGHLSISVERGAWYSIVSPEVCFSPNGAAVDSG